MRVMVTCGNLLFIVAVIILIHSTIISRNIRENEVAGALSDSADYGVDCMSDYYEQIEYEPAKKEEYLTDMMQIFCHVVAERIGTDGNLVIELKEADLEKGLFSFTLKETYTFPLGQRKGVCYIEKVYRLI